MKSFEGIGSGNIHVIRTHYCFDYNGLPRSVVIVTSIDSGKPLNVIIPKNVPLNKIPKEILKIVEDAMGSITNDLLLSINRNTFARKIEKQIIKILEDSILPREQCAELLSKCQSRFFVPKDRLETYERLRDGR